MFNKRIKFSLFTDLHYKHMMYASTVDDLKKVLKRADDNKVDFVIHCGDFCNDYQGSPELWKEYIFNKYDLPVHGIYGNHELEAMYNSMEFVTPKLTNAKDNVWGTDDGKISDGNIAYYYFDINGFRMVCTDTNYSYNSDEEFWEHNRTCSYGPSDGNGKGNSLGPDQLAWLENVLTDAAEKQLRCVVFSHDSFSGIWGSSPDTTAVREIFKKANSIRKGTVLMSINGHYHCYKDHLAVQDDMVFFNVYSARNGRWIPNGYEHYFDEHTYPLVVYDDDGNAIEEKEEKLSSLGMAYNTWFFEEPLSAIITVEDDGRVFIDGMKTRWMYGIEPDNSEEHKPEIDTVEFKLLENEK